MRLRLEYRQGDKYGIILDNKKLTVSEDELKQLITTIPAPERNCKLSNNVISMKSGYGNLPIKRLIPKETFKRLVRNYVEIVDSVESCINAVRDYPERNFKKYSSCSDFNAILKLEKIKVLDVDEGIIITKFGATTDENLSSGMKRLLVLAWYIKNKKAVTIDLSSCGAMHLKMAFEMIAKSGLNIKVVLRHICVHEITTKILYKGKMMSSQEYLDLLLGV